MPIEIVTDSSGKTHEFIRDFGTPIGLYDYRKSINLQEEFLTGGLSNQTLGALGWTIAGGTTTAIANEANRVGIVRRDTGASSGTTAYTAWGSTQGALPMGDSGVRWVVRLNTNDGNTTLRLGLLSGLSVSPSAGQYFEKLDGDTNWFAVTQHASVSTRVNTGIPVDTSFHSFRIERTGSSLVAFYIDNVVVAKITTNITATACVPNCQLVNSAAASKTVDIDYFDLQLLVTR